MRIIGNKPLIYYMEISDNSKHKIFSRQAYSFLEVKLRRLRKKVYESKYDTRDKNLPTVLANTVLSQPGPASRYRVQGNTFAANVISCSSKANTWRFKNISCNRNEPKQHTNIWQIEVSNSTKRYAYNRKSCRPMTS